MKSRHGDATSIAPNLSATMSDPNPPIPSAPTNPFDMNIPDLDPTLHTRILDRRITVAPIPLDQIDVYEQNREEDPEHVDALKKDILKDPNSRWGHAIHVVLGPDVDPAWLARVRGKQVTFSIPDKGRFCCISGWHRVLAARKIVEEWTSTPEAPTIDGRLSVWPANVYEPGAFHEPTKRGLLTHFFRSLGGSRAPDMDWGDEHREAVPGAHPKATSDHPQHVE